LIKASVVPGREVDRSGIPRNRFQIASRVVLFWASFTWLIMLKTSFFWWMSATAFVLALKRF
jgi:hypothetical protein